MVVPQTQKNLLEKLVEHNLIKQEQAEIVAKKQQDNGGSAVEYIVEEGYLDEKQILSFLVNKCGFHYINLDKIDIDPQAVGELPLELIQELKVIPIRRTKDILAVVMLDPLDAELQQRLAEATVCRILPFVSQKTRLVQVIEQLASAPASSPVSSSGSKSKLDYRGGMPLIEQLTFENFVVGKSNEFPYAMAVAVSKAPGKAYNPFFFYSDVGLGKTHLANAIANYLRKNNPELMIIYATCEYFCSQVLEAIKENQIDEFRQTFRQLDLLLIDDIQFLRGRDRAQEEFFHIFNSLVQNSKQVVVTCDRPPSELKVLEDRLQSRFMGGTIACIDKPNLDMRMAILDKKSQGISLPEEVKHLLADKIPNSVRDLEGALKTLLSFHSFTNRPVDMEMAQQVLKEMGL